MGFAVSTPRTVWIPPAVSPAPGTTQLYGPVSPLAATRRKIQSEFVMPKVLSTRLTSVQPAGVATLAVEGLTPIAPIITSFAVVPVGIGMPSVAGNRFWLNSNHPGSDVSSPVKPRSVAAVPPYQTVPV